MKIVYDYILIRKFVHGHTGYEAHTHSGVYRQWRSTRCLYCAYNTKAITP